MIMTAGRTAAASSAYHAPMQGISTYAVTYVWVAVWMISLVMGSLSTPRCES